MIAVRCRGCGEIIVIYNDLTPLRKAVKRAGAITCPHCGRELDLANPRIDEVKIVRG